MDPKTTRVAEIMTNEVLMLRAGTTLRQAMSALEGRGISGAPVSDEHGECVGVFSLTNMARAANFFSNEGAKGTPADEERYVGTIDEETVGDWMTAGVKSVSSTTSVEAAAKQMARAGIHRLLVTDGGGIVGILSSLDIVRWAAGLARAELPDEKIDCEIETEETAGA